MSYQPNYNNRFGYNSDPASPLIQGCWEEVEGGGFVFAPVQDPPQGPVYYAQMNGIPVQTPPIMVQSGSVPALVSPQEVYYNPIVYQGYEGAYGYQSPPIPRFPYGYGFFNDQVYPGYYNNQGNNLPPDGIVLPTIIQGNQAALTNYGVPIVEEPASPTKTVNPSGAAVSSDEDGNHQHIPRGTPSPTKEKHSDIPAPTKDYITKAMEDLNIDDASAMYVPWEPSNELHLAQLKKPRRALPKMLKYNLSTATPRVTYLFFNVQEKQVCVEFDTLELLAVNMTSASLQHIISDSTAAESVEIESTDYVESLLTASTHLWEEFLKQCKHLCFSGKFRIAEVERVVQCSRVTHLHCPRIIMDIGRLRSLSRFFPRTVKDVYFNTLSTDNRGFIDSITTLYCDYFDRKCSKQPCFDSIVLVVEDFPLQRAFPTQIERLLEMLRYNGSAAILSTRHGDNAVMEIIKAQGFRYCCQFYMNNVQGELEYFDYWSGEFKNHKNIMLGFKSRNIPNLKPEKMPTLNS